MSYLVINRINTDDDFSYDKMDSLLKSCNSKEEVFEYIQEIMASLLNVDSEEEWIPKEISEMAKKWLKYYYNKIYLVPEFYFGNYQIDFEIIYIDNKSNETSKTIQDDHCFKKISDLELEELSPNDYIELNDYFTTLSSEDINKYYTFENQTGDDFSYIKQLNYFRGLKKN